MNGHKKRRLFIQRIRAGDGSVSIVVKTDRGKRRMPQKTTPGERAGDFIMGDEFGHQSRHRSVYVLAQQYRFLMAVVDRHLVGSLHSRGMVLNCKGSPASRETHEGGSIAECDRMGAGGEAVGNGVNSCESSGWKRPSTGTDKRESDYVDFGEVKGRRSPRSSDKEARRALRAFCSSTKRALGQHNDYMKG